MHLWTVPVSSTSSRFKASNSTFWEHIQCPAASAPPLRAVDWLKRLHWKGLGSSPFGQRHEEGIAASHFVGASWNVMEGPRTRCCLCYFVYAAEISRWAVFSWYTDTIRSQESQSWVAGQFTVVSQCHSSDSRFSVSFGAKTILFRMIWDVMCMNPSCSSKYWINN